MEESEAILIEHLVKIVEFSKLPAAWTLLETDLNDHYETLLYMDNWLMDQYDVFYKKAQDNNNYLANSTTSEDSNSRTSDADDEIILLV